MEWLSKLWSKAQKLWQKNPEASIQQPQVDESHKSHNGIDALRAEAKKIHVGNLAQQFATELYKITPKTAPEKGPEVLDEYIVGMALIQGAQRDHRKEGKENFAQLLAEVDSQSKSYLKKEQINNRVEPTQSPKVKVHKRLKQLSRGGD